MSDDEGRIILGLLLCWGLNVAEIFVGILMLNSLIVGVAMIGGVGVLQLVYVLPLYFWFKKQGKTDTAKGMVIAASITALLNAACWGMFYGHLS
ncbi:MAG TPA: hypothetical protein VGJ33_15415 [Candidatus Angelobacter sp.]|jgi:hypothetical protein